jgi:hypothetical protein
MIFLRKVNGLKTLCNYVSKNGIIRYDLSETKFRWGGEANEQSIRQARKSWKIYI